MRRASEYRLIRIAAAATLIAGCASEAPKPSQISGFLGNYSNMTEIPAPEGQEAFRWVSPKLTPSNYDAVMIPGVQFYPRAEPTAQLSQGTLDAIGNYATTSFVRAAEEKIRVVTNPGPGVVKVSVAITGVKTAEKGLAVYQYVPIAFVVTMAKRGVAGAPEQAKIVTEILATDSLTGEVLGKGIRIGTGKELAEATGGVEKVITLDDVKPVIDSWANLVVGHATQFIKAK